LTAALTATVPAASTTAATACAWAAETTAATRSARWTITTCGRWTRLVNNEWATFNWFAIHTSDSGLRALIRSHRNKCETTHAAGFTIHWQVHVGHFTERTKFVAQHVLRSAKADVAYKQTITHYSKLSLKISTRAFQGLRSVSANTHRSNITRAPGNSLTYEIWAF
jgi:hypothetical protein